MKTKQLIFFLLIFFLFANCKKEIDLNLPKEEQKIVINGVLASDSTAIVSITNSINATLNYRTGSSDNILKIPRISDAQVSLYRNGVFIEKLNCNQKKFYVSKTKIVGNQEYELKISVNGKNFDTKIKVPHKQYFTEIKNLDYDDVNSNYRINLQIADKKGDDYYIIAQSTIIPQVFYNDTGSVDSISFEKKPITINSQISGDPYLKHIVSFPPYFDYAIMFDDALFDGKIFDKTFYIGNNFFIDTSVVHIDSITFYFQLFTISKDLYNFFISYQKYTQADGNPFSEPVNIYSNIEKGTGILCGLSSTIDSVRVPYIKNENYQNKSISPY